MRPRIIDRPDSKFCVRSGFGPEPESITATVIPAPVEIVWASLMFATSSPHCELKAGSFEAAAIGMTAIWLPMNASAATKQSELSFLVGEINFNHAPVE